MSQVARILKRLRSGPATRTELEQFTSNVGARINDLRIQGYVISVDRGINGRTVFTLVDGQNARICPQCRKNVIQNAKASVCGHCEVAGRFIEPTHEQCRAIIKLFNDYASLSSIREQLGVSRAQIDAALEKVGLDAANRVRPRKAKVWKAKVKPYKCIDCGQPCTRSGGRCEKCRAMVIAKALHECPDCGRPIVPSDRRYCPECWKARKERIKVTEDKKQAVIDLWLMGEPQWGIWRKLHMSASSVRQIVRESGIKRPSPHNIKLHGLGASQLQEKLTNQEFKCAICGTPIAGAINGRTIANLHPPPKKLRSTGIASFLRGARPKGPHLFVCTPNSPIPYPITLHIP